MGFGGSMDGCQAGRKFHFDFTSPTTGQCCAPVMETYAFLAFIAFTAAAAWFLRSETTCSIFFRGSWWIEAQCQ